MSKMNISDFPRTEVKPYPNDFDMSTLVGRVFKVKSSTLPEVHLCTGYIHNLLVIGGKGFNKILIFDELEIRETRLDNDHNRTFVWVPTGVRE